MGLSETSVELVPVAKIVEGIRRRKKLGNIAALMRSIENHDLIHPIVIRNGNELVAGARRLEAFRRLNRKTIPARRVESMSDEELRAIELDENTARLALDDFEASKARLAQIRQAEADLKAKAVSSQLETKLSKRGRKGEGRPKRAGSMRDIEKATGVSKAEQQRIEDHVALAERFPFMQRPGWKQHSVLAAGEQIEKLSANEQPKVAALLDQEAIPPRTAIEILTNLASKPVSERREILTLAESPDAFERKTALVQAKALPPEPDPGLIELGAAKRSLQQAAKMCRTETFKEPITKVAEQVARLHERFEEHHRAR